MELEGLVCPECNEPLKEKELAKSLICPRCRTNLKNRKYLDFVEFLMAQGIVTDMDFFDQALYGADAVLSRTAKNRMKPIRTNLSASIIRSRTWMRMLISTK